MKIRTMLTVSTASFFAFTASAASVSCAQDDQTEKLMCFPAGAMRTSTDGQVRDFPLSSGGPKNITKTGHTARIFCNDKFVAVMELRDSSGVVFSRNQAVTQVGRDLAASACKHTPTRIDKALDKVKRL